MAARVATKMNTTEFLRSSRRVRFGLAALFLLASLAIFACNSGPDSEPGATHVLTADGVVNPVMDRYIDRGIDAAEDEQAGAVVIRLDTPGGLSSSMDDIIKRIIDSKVPVIVYVWPSGGRAASAGTYIAYAAHVAAMAPATSIGSATPIDASGGDIEGDLGNKVKGDAVAKIRGLAELRGRNADWGERAVLEGISAHTDEAVEQKIVDLKAENIEELLAAVDGRKVTLPTGEATLATARYAGGVQQHELHRGLPQHPRGPEHRVPTAFPRFAGDLHRVHQPGDDLRRRTSA